jgi:hypothetical protein
VSPAPAPSKILLIAVGDARDQETFKAATQLAKSHGAGLVLAAVLSRLPPPFQRLSLVIEPSELWRLALRERIQYLETLAAERLADVGVGTRILFGGTVEAILGEVSLRQYTLVILACSRWTKYVPDCLRFDLPMRLARRCPCPVWTSDSHCREQVWRVRSLGSLTAH